MYYLSYHNILSNGAKTEHSLIFFWWYWLCLCWVRNPAFYVISFDYHYCRGNGIMHLPYITYCLLLYKGTTCLLHSLSLFTGCLIRRMICMIKDKIINCMYDLTSHLIVYSSSRPKLCQCLICPPLHLK